MGGNFLKLSKTNFGPYFLDKFKENLRKFFISNPMESYKG
jgi:hypothetical protein